MKGKLSQSFHHLFDELSYFGLNLNKGSCYIFFKWQLNWTQNPFTPDVHLAVLFYMNAYTVKWCSAHNARSFEVESCCLIGISHWMTSSHTHTYTSIVLCHIIRDYSAQISWCIFSSLSSYFDTLGITIWHKPVDPILWQIWQHKLASVGLCHRGANIVF